MLGTKPRSHVQQKIVLATSSLKKQVSENSEKQLPKTQVNNIKKPLAGLCGNKAKQNREE